MKRDVAFDGIPGEEGVDYTSETLDELTNGKGEDEE